MIKSFKDRRTAALAEGRALKGLPPDVLKRASNKLFLLDTVTRLQDLRVPPGNRLEALMGERAGQHSIRVNEQWRICFVWKEDGVHDVEFVDYHQEMNMPRDLTMPHPGAVLREEFLEPMNLSVYALAKAIHVPRSRLNEICRGRQGISANVALRLGKYFGVDPQWFLNMQAKYDLHVEGEALVEELSTIVTRSAA